MPKSFEQSEKTKYFISEVKNLVENAIEPTYKAVADKLTWNHNALSQVMRGSRDVPNDVYRRFESIYKSVQGSVQVVTQAGTDYRDKYIALLEQQVAEKERRLQALEDKITSYLNSNKLEAYLQSLHALANTQLDSLLEHRAASEKKDLKKLRTAADTVFDEYQHQILSTGK